MILALTLLAVYANAQTACTMPAMSTGYTYAGSTGDAITSCDSTTCSSPTFTSAFACDTGNGYAGTATVTACDVSDATTTVLSGCAANQCKTPASLPAGYTGMSVDTAITGCTAITAGCDSPTTSGLACDTNYAGTPAVAACSGTDDDAVFSGCAANPCKTPATIPAGYTGVADTAITSCDSVTCSSPDTSTNVNLLCDTGNDFSGTVAVTACSASDDDAVLSGCVDTCVMPAMSTGYTYAGTTGDDITSCDSGTCASPTFTSALACDTGNGYAGTATVTGCTNAALDGVLSGCAAQQCKVPGTVPTGYTGMTADADITGCTAISGGCASPTTTNFACDTGYTGTVAVAACSGTDDDAVLSGCSLQCKVPATVPTGYTGMTAAADIASCTADACGSPTTTNFACDTGYTGTVAVAACTSPSADAAITGCSLQCKVPSTLPAGYTGMTADADIASCTADACGSPTITNFVCDSGNGFSGTVAVSACSSSDDDAVFAGCTQACVMPTITAGYTLASGTAGDAITSCTSGACGSPTITGTLACDTGNGFSGTATVTACSNSDSNAVLSGCTQACVMPTITTGYTLASGTAGDAITSCTSGACGSPTITGTLACDTGNGYTGTATVTACSLSSADAVLSGCAMQCKVPATVPTGYTGMTANDDIASCTSAACTTPTLTNFVCDSLYTGTVAAAACSFTDDDAVLSGCSLQCKVPATLPTGYTGLTVDADISGCTAADCTSPTLGSLACDTGFVGTAAVAACSSSDDDAVLSGCSMQCKVPATVPTGYTGMTADADIASCTADACTSPTLTNFACDTGYAGTVAVAACTSADDDATLSGCSMQCKVPATVPTGYTGMTADADIASCTADACTSPTLTGFACDTGYTGTVAVAACSSSDDDAVISGCTVTVTTTANPDDSALSVSVALATMIAMIMF